MTTRLTKWRIPCSLPKQNNDQIVSQQTHAVLQPLQHWSIPKRFYCYENSILERCLQINFIKLVTCKPLYVKKHGFSFRRYSCQQRPTFGLLFFERSCANQAQCYGNETNEKASSVFTVSWWRYLDK